MAINILANENTPHGVHHDLESFYWLLVWLVLQYTLHTLTPTSTPLPIPDPVPAPPPNTTQNRRSPREPSSADHFARLFGDPRASHCSHSTDPRLAAAAKRAWVYPIDDETGAREVFLRVPANAPLTDLLEALRALVLRGRWWGLGDPPVLLAHAAVLGVFRRAVGRRGEWPEDDFVCGGALRTKVAEMERELEVEAEEEAEAEEDGGVDVDVDIGVEAREDDPNSEDLDEVDAASDVDVPDYGARDVDDGAAVQCITSAPETPQERVTTCLRTKRNAAAADICPVEPELPEPHSKRCKTDRAAVQ